MSGKVQYNTNPWCGFYCCYTNLWAIGVARPRRGSSRMNEKAATGSATPPEAVTAIMSGLQSPKLRVWKQSGEPRMRRSLGICHRENYVCHCS